jgi:small subunit ribosomal protein S8
MTDPIADFLARLRNAIMSRKTTIDLPASKLKLKLAELLRDEGYLTAVALNPGGTEGQGPQGSISVSLRWDNQNRPAISGLRRVSRPGQRSYVHSDKIKKVRGGMGVAVVSTSKGLLTDRQARKQGVGGEVLCEVW